MRHVLCIAILAVLLAMGGCSQQDGLPWGFSRPAVDRMPMLPQAQNLIAREYHLNDLPPLAEAKSTAENEKDLQRFSIPPMLSLAMDGH